MATNPISESTDVNRFELWSVAAALFGVFLWRVFVSMTVNLIPDECSYWTWSRHLDWSYFDNSGMAAYFIRLSTEIFGKSTPITVRFPFVIASFITTILIYSSAVQLSRSRRVGAFAAVFFNLTPLSLLGGGAAVHDNALLLFWTLAMWSTAKFLRTENYRYFYLTGFAAGLAILSKYTGILLLPATMLWLLSSNRLRMVLMRKEPWIGAIIATLFTIPILWWNYQHDWASFKHILFIGSGYTGILRRFSDGLGYHISQFLTISPLFYLAIIAAIFLSIIAELRRGTEERSLLLCLGTPLFLFGVMSFKGHAEANWGVMGYVSTGILTVMLLSDRENPVMGFISKLFDLRKLIKIGTLISLSIVALVVVHARIGLLPASIEKDLGKNDRIIWETRGWDGLGKHLHSLMNEGDIIAADSYQLCALLEFNTPGQPSVRYLAPWERPTQFDVWNRSYDDLRGRNILFVSSKPLSPTGPTLTTVYENFSHVQELPAYEVIYHGEPIRKIFVSRCLGFDPFQPRRLGPRSLFYSDY